MTRRRTINKGQVKLVQTAVRAVGLRRDGFDGRYRLLLRQYRRPDGTPCTSSKDLDPDQMEDLLAICEAMGWRMPGQSETHFRDLVSRRRDAHVLSTAQEAAIGHLRGDLGWTDEAMRSFVGRMTDGRCEAVAQLNRADAGNVIEGMKSILGRDRGTTYGRVADAARDMEAPHG